MTDLPSLIERLKAAEGPSRELDFDIASALGLCQTRNGVAYQWSEAGSTSYLYYPPEFTASLDATIALVERKLPGWSFGFIADPHVSNVLAWVEPESHYEGRHGGRYSSKTTTPALALLAALLTALQEQEEGR